MLTEYVDNCIIKVVRIIKIFKIKERAQEGENGI